MATVHVRRTDGTRATVCSLLHSQMGHGMMGRHNVSYRASKDLTGRSYWGQTSKWKAGISRRIERACAYSYNDRQPQHLRSRIGQAKHDTQRIRRDTWTLFMLAALWAALRDLACFRVRHAIRRLAARSTCGIARKVPFTAGAIRGDTK
jgi:hypothetical protein